MLSVSACRCVCWLLHVVCVWTDVRVLSGWLSFLLFVCVVVYVLCVCLMFVGCLLSVYCCKLSVCLLAACDDVRVMYASLLSVVCLCVVA